MILHGFIDEIEKNAGLWSWIKGLFHKDQNRQLKAPSPMKVRRLKMPITTDITAAGRGKKLVKFNYKDQDRLVEPYSFRTARDGSVHFFGFDRGANSIKQFKLDQIKNFSVTEEDFEPRWPVEV